MKDVAQRLHHKWIIKKKPWFGHAQWDFCYLSKQSLSITYSHSLCEEGGTLKWPLTGRHPAPPLKTTCAYKVHVGLDWILSTEKPRHT